MNIALVGSSSVRHRRVSGPKQRLSRARAAIAAAYTGSSSEEVGISDPSLSLINLQIINVCKFFKVYFLSTNNKDNYFTIEKKKLMKLREVFF